jgi:hypothetical protein
VKDLIIDSIKYLENIDFQNISIITLSDAMLQFSIAHKHDKNNKIRE